MTSDLEWINAALEAARLAGGATVLLEPRDYLVDGTVEGQPGTGLVGTNQRQTRIVIEPNAIAPYIRPILSARNFMRVSDITFVGTWDAESTGDQAQAGI